MVLALLKSESIICFSKDFVKTDMKMGGRAGDGLSFAVGPRLPRYLQRCGRLPLLALAGDQGCSEMTGARGSPWRRSSLRGA
jgi:hypothetical protein